MDRDVAPGYRLRLVLGKFRVIQLKKGKDGFRAVLDLGNAVKMTIDSDIRADIRLHDLLTFYTEVPYAEPKPTPKQ